jgi:hypothetical protein
VNRLTEAHPDEGRSHRGLQARNGWRRSNGKQQAGTAYNVTQTNTHLRIFTRDLDARAWVSDDLEVLDIAKQVAARLSVQKRRDA